MIKWGVISRASGESINRMVNCSAQLNPDELYLQVHITSRCNLTCKHCYVDEAPADMDIDLLELVIRQFDDLRQHLKIRHTWVQLTGGEPLLHPQISEVLNAASRVFPVRLLTNGTLIDSKMAQMLAESCKAVQISFDGTPETHDSWRGKGSFEAAYSGLMALKDAGVYRSVRVTIGRDNQHDVMNLLEQLTPHIDAFNVSRVVPAGSCSVDQPEVSLYRKLIYRLYAESFTNPVVNLKDPFFGVLINVDNPGSGFYGCSAGISGLCVTETGDIYPCRRLPIKLGNVKEQSLKDIYIEHPLLIALRSREINGKCGICENKLTCGGSRCIAYALTGDPLGEDQGCIF